MAVSRINEAGLNVNQYGNRNLIINGEMQCWQRATAATAANNNYNTVDRFRPYVSGGAYTTERSTDNPNGTGNGFSLKCQVTTADTSIAAGEYAFINHEIEAQNLQHLQYGTSSAKNVTLSFWVKSSKTGTYTVGVYKHANGATAYMYRKEYTISAANTWEKKEFTISPTAGSTTFMTNSGGAIANNNGNGFGVSFNLMLGSNFHGTNDAWAADAKYGTSNQVNWMDNTSNNFYITQIQMEVGDTATDFEHRTFDDEYRKCLRYYERWDFPDTGDYSTVLMYNESTDQARGPLNCTVYKRANPAFSATASSWGAISTGSSGTAVSISATNLKPWGCRIEITKSNSTLIDGGASYLRCLNSGAHIALDAEL
tara:strand:+ start:142 stop:1251 length:1110 start_codon:yes stop_codon:yes gene_type:complete